MKHLNSGWQYNVYDLGNGRVIKRQVPWRDQFKRIRARKDKKSIIKTLKEIRRINNTGKKSIKDFKKILPKIDKSLFGNPVFLRGINYTQDKVTIFRDYVAGNPENAKKFIDGHVSLLEYMWSQGFADTVYNFALNNGVDARGRVIHLDLGEMAFDYGRVLRSIQNKGWLKTHSFINLSKEMQVYFEEQVGKKLTLENLDRHWPKVIQ